LRRYAWAVAVLVTALAALVLRLALIGHYLNGGYDLQIYTYFSDLFRHGINPYHAPASGPINPVYGDNQPGEMGLLALLLSVRDSPETLRVFFAICEALCVAVVGWFYPRSYRWRAAVMAILAFNPLLLLWWTVYAEDKGLCLLLLLVIVIAIERGAPNVSLIASGVLGALKWLSGFFALPLVAYAWTKRKTEQVWRFWASLLLAATCVIVAQIPYFPANLLPYSRRENRIGYPPGNASITVLLARTGIYSSWIPRLGIPLAIFVLYVLFFRRKLDIVETIILTVFASFVILPDESTDRILLITLPLLLITRLTALRQLAFWLISVVAAIVAFSVSYAADMPLPLLHTHPSVARALVSVGTWLGGAYASPRYVIFENLPMVLLLGLFIADKVRGRSQSVTTHSAQTSSEVVA
jgi:hypothetical protein